MNEVQWLDTALFPGPNKSKNVSNKHVYNELKSEFSQLTMAQSFAKVLHTFRVQGQSLANDRGVSKDVSAFNNVDILYSNGDPYYAFGGFVPCSHGQCLGLNGCSWWTHVFNSLTYVP
jgi:hypothetical protein